MQLSVSIVAKMLKVLFHAGSLLHQMAYDHQLRIHHRIEVIQNLLFPNDYWLLSHTLYLESKYADRDLRTAQRFQRHPTTNVFLHLLQRYIWDQFQLFLWHRIHQHFHQVQNLLEFAEFQ